MSASPVPSGTADSPPKRGWSLEHNEGGAVAPGGALAALSADPGHVWEALRALYVVGRTEDLEDVRRFTRPVAGMPERAARQAALTEQAIQARGQ